MNWSTEPHLGQLPCKDINGRRLKSGRVMGCASPLALEKSWLAESARELAHSQTCR